MRSMWCVAVVLAILVRAIDAHEAHSGGKMDFVRHGRVRGFDYVTWSHTEVHPHTVRASSVSLSSSSSSSSLHKRQQEHLDQLHRAPESHESFLLQLDAYNKTFCFHMHPNYDLIHPEARMVHQDQQFSEQLGGGRRRVRPGSEPLTAKAYRGFVMAVLDHGDGTVDADRYQCRWSTQVPAYEHYGEDTTLGWARFVVGDNEYERAGPLHGGNERLHKMSSSAVEFQGAFMYRNELYAVRNIRQYQLLRKDGDVDVPDAGSDDRLRHQQTAQMMVFRRSDVRQDFDADNGSDDSQQHRLHRRHLEEHQYCGHDQLEWNTDPVGGASAFLKAKLRGVSYSRDYMRQTYRDTSLVGHYISVQKRAIQSGCPLSKRVLYMGVVLGCTYIRAHGTAAAARQQVIDNWNIVSKVYEETFNIYLGLLDIISMPTCGDLNFNADCSDGYVIGKRLSDFSKWRGDTQPSSAGLWHLMSTCSTGPTIGIAWLNMLCQTSVFDQTNSDGSVDHVSGAGISTVVTYEWMVVAHEIGHNFGASHDCTSSLCVGCTTNPCASCCPCTTQCDCQSAYLMNPSNNVNPNTPGFSPCSQTDICKKNQLFGVCLETPGSRIALNGGICGNGLREGDEQCDSNGVDDACCYKNCTLKASAQCSDSNDGCCQNCTIVPASAKRVCRPAETECDVEEVCAGNATCPADLFQRDGLVCGNDTTLNTKCASGVCTSRDAQCLAYGKGDVTGDCTSFSGQCLMFCNTPFAGCIKVSGNFRNGTPCGNDGFCYGASCSNPDTLGAFIEWVINNKNMAIVIFVVAGVILFAAVSKCMSKPKIERRNQLATQIQFEEEEMKRIKQIEAQRQKRRQMEKDALDKRNAAEQSSSGGGKPRPGTVSKSSNIAQQMNQQRRTSESAGGSSGRRAGTGESSSKGGKLSAPNGARAKSYDPRSPISEADEEAHY